jgi:hypothetical protein
MQAYKSTSLSYIFVTVQTAQFCDNAPEFCDRQATDWREACLYWNFIEVFFRNFKSYTELITAALSDEKD